MHKSIFSLLLIGVLLLCAQTAQAQEGDTKRIYGDTARVSAVEYLTDFNAALAQSRKTGKPVFFNCYVSWAATCVAMDQYVFSNKKFAQRLQKNFVCLQVNMRSEEGRKLAKRYGVKSYAYYLILDADGNVVQRIQGGSKLPEFWDNISIALSPKTSLAGTRARYESGSYTRDDLYAYLRALRVAGADSTFFALAPQYTKDMEMADYAKAGNWMFVGLYRGRDNDLYRYMLHHKADFLQNNAQLQVDNKFCSMLTPTLLSYACGETAYDSADIAQIRADLKTFLLPDTCACAVLCDIADLRGQNRIADLIRYMDTSGRYLDPYRGVRANIEQTFKFPAASAADRATVVAYLHRAVEREKGTRSGDRLRAFVESLETAGKGITFATGSLADVLAQAKAEGKKVFLDCYTSWCGPCRVMSNTVFTRTEVGTFFNDHFVCLKLDMEQGEGPDVAKRYGVKAFPTMLILSPEGEVLHTIVGARSADALIGEAKTALGK